MIFNPYFLLFLLFIIYLYKNRNTKYKEILKEEFYSKNTLTENNFVNKYISVKDIKNYSVTTDVDPKLKEIFTSYKYSLNFYFGNLLSKVFRIKNVESKGLYDSISKLILNPKNGTFDKNKLLLSSESNFLNLVNDNKITDYDFVCSLYKTHFMMIARVELKIFNWTDILDYNILRTRKKFDDELPNKLRIGIPDNRSDSYHDALKLFKCIGIDMTKPNDKIKIVIDTERNLFNIMKNKINSDNTIDLLYLTSSYKNHYFEEFLQTNSVSIFGTEGIKESLIKAEFKDTIFKNRIDNGKYTSLIKKKNIYDNPEKITGTMKIATNDKENKIIGTKFHKTYGSRIIIIAHKECDKNYIKYLLRNLYGSIDRLRKKMNDYLLNQERLNIIDDILEPHEMFYMNEKMNYHKGADEFFREIHFITDEENLKQNIYYRTNQTNLFSKLFIN